MFLPRIALLFVAVALMLTAVPSSAQLQSEGVVYSYMSMRVGAEQQPVLMPLPATQVRPDLPPQSQIPAAFGLLRNGKPATYGGATVTVSDALIAQERVAVNLDPAADSTAFEIIAAETVLTFTAIGIDTVIFPGWADQGLRAEDIRYATYRFQVPMWQALVGGVTPGADIVLPNGDQMDGRTFFSRMEDADPSLHDMALDILRGEDRLTRYTLLGAIAGLGIDNYERAVIPLLQDEDQYHREAALRALGASEREDAWEAIVSMMSEDPDPGLQLLASQYLALSVLESFRVYEVFYRAEAADPTVRLAAIAELAALPGERVVARLGGYLPDTAPEIRQGAADALHALEAWTMLRESMNNDELDSDVRLVLATALADDAGGDDQLVGLEYRGRVSVGEIAIDALSRTASVDGVNPRQTIERFLDHEDVNVGVFAASMLSARGEEASLDALAETGGDTDRPLDLLYAAGDAAYVILGGLGTNTIEEYAANRDSFLKRAAYRALGDLAAEDPDDAGIFRTLSAGLSDSDAGIRGASARALACYGTAAALELIISVEQDPEASVQADVALAMQKFPGEEFADIVSPTIVGYVQSGEPVVIAAALDSLAALEHRTLLPVALEKVHYPDARVRASAMRAAAALADPSDLRPVINAIGAGLADDEIPNRVLSAQLLGTFSDARAVISISQVVNGPEPEVRYAAIASLGVTGHPDAVGTLLALLEDPEREIRLAAVDGLRSLNMVSAIMGVEAQIGRETDPASLDALSILLVELQTDGI
jgi:HEAT repeat protein